MRSHRLIALVLCCITLAGCAATRTSRPIAPRPAIINHIVFFTLNDPADADALIHDCDTLLASIPGVVTYACGKHLDTGRPTVDGNYDVGLYVGFNSREDYAAYVEHPAHKDLVTCWRPKIKSMRIHDINDETK